MEELREQIARDRDEENRITEQQRNKELQNQLAVSQDDACVRECLKGVTRRSPHYCKVFCPLFLCFPPHTG